MATGFEREIESGNVRKISPDKGKSISYTRQAEKRLAYAKSNALTEENAPFVLVDFYEAVRTLCEGLGAKRGFKFETHAAITLFLRDVLKDADSSRIFEKSRKLRNCVNYYAETVSREHAEGLTAQLVDVFKKLKNC